MQISYYNSCYLKYSFIRIYVLLCAVMISYDFLKTVSDLKIFYLYLILENFSCKNWLIKYDVIDKIGSVILNNRESVEQWFLIKSCELLSFVYKGSFGTCYSVQQIDTGDIYACKALNKAKLQMIYTEIDIHTKLKHEHVVEMITTFEKTEYVHMILVMCENSSLSKLLDQRMVLYV